MSRIVKVICDNCKKEIDLDEWYYSARVYRERTNLDKGKSLMQGDYCKNCFNAGLKEILNLKGE